MRLLEWRGSIFVNYLSGSEFQRVLLVLREFSNCLGKDALLGRCGWVERLVLHSSFNLILLSRRSGLGLDMVHHVIDVLGSIEHVCRSSSVSKVYVLQFAQMVVEFLAGQNLRIVVVVSHVFSHSSESSSL